ncbi:hypothetical protein G7075_04370 [Phycicoccus sp. HDW14]|uniref:hypothetical protein n=1 Tax=Phycicoccus sp. HDW14 TaxID=2714941 RepID=UPI00140A549B|nr:hypothetical protein [Phycicoccus sp. HDW14]QIM20553.1 hypothetical protein G7075_04370 [Phycicoccus sp. HDW14]
MVDEFYDPRDVPAGHRCPTDGPARCTHEEIAHRALLVRLAAITLPGTGAPRDPDVPKAKSQKGSPAPWASAPAHLIDEVHRGAIRFDRLLRTALDLGPLHVYRGVASRPRITAPCPDGLPPFAPCTHPTCQPIRKTITTVSSATPSDIAGPAALRGLPLLVELLLEHDATDPLVAGPLVDPDRPDRGRSWGQVERTVRHWHTEARAQTGHEDKPVVLRQRANPFAGQPWAGPTCEDPWSDECQHLSCRLVDLAQRPAWEAAACPHCGTVGFPWDQTWGVLRCDHPRCRDENGRRPAWSMEAFMKPITEISDAFERQLR